MSNLIYYFGGGNTAKGFIPFYESIFYDIDKVYVLKNGSNRYKTKILENFSKQYSVLYKVEVIKSSVDNNEIEAIKVPELDIAIINGNLIHGNNIEIEKGVKIEIDLSKAMDLNIVNDNKDKLEVLKNKIFENLNSTYKSFENALKIHDKLEELYYKNMDFSKSDKDIKELIERLVNKSKKAEGKVYHRYLGAATPKGAVDFVPNITEGVKRYFLKGRAGTGKSTILKQIAKKAEENGFTVEVYHCGFDPQSLDMVVVRELNFAIFDSTPPHEYYPSREDDEVFDTYKEFCISDVDKIFEKEIESITKEYKKYKVKAINFLKIAKEYKDKYDDIYDEAIDEKEANLIINRSLPYIK